MDSVHIIRVALVGESTVGKTSLMARYCFNTFLENTRSTDGCGRGVKMITVDGQTVGIEVVDTAGSEKYRSTAKTHFRAAEAILIVYDITNQKSFDELSFWVEEIRQHASQQVLLSLVGNKEDLIANEVVSIRRAQKLANLIDAPFSKTSARSNFAVSQVFEEIAQRYIKRPELHKAQKKPIKIRRNLKPARRCC